MCMGILNCHFAHLMVVATSSDMILFDFFPVHQLLDLIMHSCALFRVHLSLSLKGDVGSWVQIQVRLGFFLRVGALNLA